MRAVSELPPTPTRGDRPDQLTRRALALEICSVGKTDGLTHPPAGQIRGVLVIISDNVALSVASKPIFTFRFRVPRFKVPRFQVPRWGREIVEVQGSEVPGSAAGAVRLWEVPRFQGSRFHVSGGNMRGVK